DLLGTVTKPETAQILRRFMVGVVERGTATPVKSKIVSIAGKTGTAQVPDTIKHTYKNGKYVASFMGFFPADQPQIAGIVVLHEPEPIHYGGYTSGPVFKSIAERYTLANPDEVRPDTKLVASYAVKGLIDIPDFTGREMSLAKQMAQRKGIELVTNVSCGIIIWQYPPAGQKIYGNGKVAVLVDSGTDSLSMADMSGMNMRMAISLLNRLGIEFEVQGSGLVDSQIPPAGAIVDKNVKCRLICTNRITDEDSVKRVN
ncbi:MAG: penicillin-binding transpeptidase domain-containing protein, partial [candidate division Zixibacteria bacterium]|nr:penicillin-binding transpeptidase domain-containing protein [candidate division Zixibacteria bacterium]